MNLFSITKQEIHRYLGLYNYTVNPWSHQTSIKHKQIYGYTNICMYIRTAYRCATYIESRFLRFDRYIVSEVSVSIKISKRKYFDILVSSWLSSRQNQRSASPNISTATQEYNIDDNHDIIVYENK